jgi:class 3 adenylate cyclase
MVLEPAVRNDLVELIAANFRTDEVNELGKLVLRRFDCNEASGTRNHVSLSSRKSAKLLVDQCDQRGEVPALIKLAVEMDEAVILGRPIRVDDLEAFLGKLARAGIRYDFKTRKVLSSSVDPDGLVNWGCLKDGREYDTSVISLDVTGNSALVRRHGNRRMEKLSFMLWSFLREKLSCVDGRIWSWAGDGGIVAFALKGHAQRAARFAVEVQSTVPVFNLSLPEDLPMEIALRIGIDTGKVKFLMETGKIVSDVINYAAHLEKKSTSPGAISISRGVYDVLPMRLRALFRYGGIFEEKDFFSTPRRLDTALSDDVPDETRLG